MSSRCQYRLFPTLVFPHQKTNQQLCRQDSIVKIPESRGEAEALPWTKKGKKKSPIFNHTTSLLSQHSAVSRGLSPMENESPRQTLSSPNVVKHFRRPTQVLPHGDHQVNLQGLTMGIRQRKRASLTSTSARILVDRIPACSCDQAEIQASGFANLQNKARGPSVGTEFRWQFCLIWIFSQQATPITEPILSPHQSGKQILSPI